MIHYAEKLSDLERSYRGSRHQVNIRARQSAIYQYMPSWFPELHLFIIEYWYSTTGLTFTFTELLRWRSTAEPTKSS